MKQGGNYFYPTYDGNGNVTEYLESDEDIAAHFEYDPFGNLTVDTNSNAESFPYRFSTKPQDAETGLYYYTYRYYDPLTGRWPSRDPIGEYGGVNLYGFVRNDGIGSRDMLGLVDEPLLPPFDDGTGRFELIPPLPPEQDIEFPGLPDPPPIPKEIQPPHWDGDKVKSEVDTCYECTTTGEMDFDFSLEDMNNYLDRVGKSKIPERDKALINKVVWSFLPDAKGNQKTEKDYILGIRFMVK